MLVLQSQRLLLNLEHNFFLLKVLRDKFSLFQLLLGPKKSSFFPAFQHFWVI